MIEQIVYSYMWKVNHFYWVGMQHFVKVKISCYINVRLWMGIVVKIMLCSDILFLCL